LVEFMLPVLATSVFSLIMVDSQQALVVSYAEPESNTGKICKQVCVNTSNRPWWESQVGDRKYWFNHKQGTVNFESFLVVNGLGRWFLPVPKPVQFGGPGE